MSKYKFEAVIFDLDGVITKTALVHSAAWKKMFDDYLLMREKRDGEKFTEFSHEKDYLPFVDGKPRYKGVESFLQSRGIEIPFGDPSDSHEMETICGLGNMKNKAFNEVLERDGVAVYQSTVDLMHELNANGIRVGVASSSKNCKSVLEATGLIDLIETRVDGVVSAEIGLSGKPEPDIFTTAADNLGIPYDKAVVVEDAVSGVQAGKAGNFGLVLGIAREDNKHELKSNGADLVVEDISEIGFEGICNWFEKGLEDDNWSVSYSDYIPEKEKTRETLLSVGNGYLGTRGALEETHAGKFNYPGTYIAGLYNRLISMVGDRDVENEDFVNIPNWLSFQFKVGNDDWIDINSVKILDIKRRLNFKTGVLCRSIHLKDNSGREMQVRSERIASMDNPHLVSLQYEITPINFKDTIIFKSSLDGNIINDGVARYRQLNQKHLSPIEQDARDNTSFLLVKTVQSDIQIGLASKLNAFIDNETLNPKYRVTTDFSSVSTECVVDANLNSTIKFVKTVAIYTSQEWDSKDPKNDAIETLRMADDFDKMKGKSAEAWRKIWNEIDIQVEGDRLAQKLLRMHLFHLMVSLSPNSACYDASITARGLHGEAYRGHIFWDELFILPLYNIHFPEVMKAALMYRYRRLDAAKKYAKQHGYKGAMFPWQSGSDGREETQVVHLNPLTGKWGDDYSSFQRHVSLAIAYNTWEYYQASNDVEFMQKYGAEMFLEICRFWASKATLNAESRRYSIQNVMGPDEFHEKYPGAKEGGLKDNTYTNLMVVWTLSRGLELLENLENAVETVKSKIQLSVVELERWKDISSRMNIVIENNILAQYDGYFDLKELDWESYRQKYNNIYRMDRLLKAEGRSADDFKVAKQADTLQTFYNLDETEVSEILSKLGCQLSDDYLSRNLEYYLHRTSHGSTLSRVVHAQLANMINETELSWALYKDALTSDYADVQGGTTGEGIHAGVMAGTVLIALQSYAGLNLKGDVVKIEPNLPEHWRKIKFGFNFKKVTYKCEITQNAVAIWQNNKLGKDVEILIKEDKYKVTNNRLNEIKL